MFVHVHAAGKSNCCRRIIAVHTIKQRTRRQAIPDKGVFLRAAGRDFGARGFVVFLAHVKAGKGVLLYQRRIYHFIPAS